MLRDSPKSRAIVPMAGQQVPFLPVRSFRYIYTVTHRCGISA
nr:MAG TPA: hypothetical protein [Caudoviricetes sp.]